MILGLFGAMITTLITNSEWPFVDAYRRDLPRSPKRAAKASVSSTRGSDIA